MSNGCAPSAEFPELVPDEGAELAGLGGGFASGFGGVQDARMMLLEHAAATLLRRPRAIHEQNGILGRVNEVFAKRVDAVACGSGGSSVGGGSGAWQAVAIRASEAIRAKRIPGMATILM